MRITTSKKLDPSILGERKLSEYSYKDFTGESNDGMRRGYSYTVYCKVFGTIENETKNQDGTYTYEYSSRIEKDRDQYGDGIRKPSDSEFDLNEMIQELLFTYNIHEFSTDLQEEVNNIKDYYADIKATSTYQKENEPSISYTWLIGNKDSKNYIEPDNSQTSVNLGDSWSPYWTVEEKAKSESIEDLNKKINEAFSKDDYILYLMGDKVKKAYKIKLGFNDIGEDENVKDYLKRMQLENPKYTTFESALKENAITIEDIKSLILEHRDLSGKEIPLDILEQLFSDEPELISNFNEREMPIDILRKYSPNFDITKVNPIDLAPIDLDNVLQNVIQCHCILGIYNGPSEKELKQGYWEYLQSFYDNPDALRKIIPVINTSWEYFFTSQAKDYINQISPEIMNKSEIRDILLETKNIELAQVFKYEINYDKDSAKKLMKILSNAKSNTSLGYINDVFDILQQNGINKDEMLQSLRENGFNIGIIDSKENQEIITRFKSFGIDGITLDDLRDSIMKNKNFNFLKLTDNISSEDMTREYRRLLNELADKKGKKDDNYPKRYEEIFELMCNYSNASELFSKLTPEVKELTKKLMIENLDLIEELQEKPIGYYSKFSKVMNVMSSSFDISEDDMVNIYMKCLNNGASKKEIISELQQYMPEEDRQGFEEKINSSSIYPNPKYFWLTDKNIKRISVKRGENRTTIKSKIQADGRCFSTRVKTDMVGKSKDGKKIVVNNLSKWLFGVPGAKGNLTITRMGNYIQLPGNTPDEVIELIEAILMERENDGPSRD